MKSLNYYFRKAREGKYALGHFNFANAEQLKAIVRAFQSVIENLKLKIENYALMVGTSEGEAEFLGYDQSVGLVDAWRKQTGLPIFLNADHHKSFESCKKAIDAGYDTVLIDGSGLPYHENITITKKVIEYAKRKNPEITVEGELGYLKGSSEVQRKVQISPADYTQPNLVFNFLSHARVDRLAVVFGNIHGIVTDQEERLDIEHLKRIILAINSSRVTFHRSAYLVLHGASGLQDEDVKAAIKAGITNVHINTEIRVAFHQALEDFEKSPQPHTTTPYKIMAPTVEAMQKVAEDKLKLFTNP